MGWKGVLRDMEREAKRQKKQSEKREKLQHAVDAVTEYERHVESLVSLHKTCGELCDWGQMECEEQPEKPKNSCFYEGKAQRRLDGFRPNIFHKLFKMTENTRRKLAENVVLARKKDESEYQQRLEVYETEYAAWDVNRVLARKVLSGDKSCYDDVIKRSNRFVDIPIGTYIAFSFDKPIVEVILNVNGEDVIPPEMVSVRQGGSLSIKKMPTRTHNELYQDHICSSVLRVAREVFALFPEKLVLITAMAKLLNTSTGHLDDQPILSVVVSKNTIEGVDLDNIDPSDCMNNFVHNMEHTMSKGFSPVQVLSPTEFGELEQVV